MVAVVMEPDGTTTSQAPGADRPSPSPRRSRRVCSTSTGPTNTRILSISSRASSARGCFARIPSETAAVASPAPLGGGGTSGGEAGAARWRSPPPPSAAGPGRVCCGDRVARLRRRAWLFTVARPCVKTLGVSVLSGKGTKNKCSKRSRTAASPRTRATSTSTRCSRTPSRRCGVAGGRRGPRRLRRRRRERRVGHALLDAALAAEFLFPAGAGACGLGADCALLCGVLRPSWCKLPSSLKTHQSALSIVSEDATK